MRKIFLFIAVFFILLIVSVFVFIPSQWWISAVLGLLLLLGFYDYFQNSHAIRRNFPLLGRLRYFFESIRPEIQQYFVESDTNGKPFSRLQRSVIYSRAKGETDTSPFGTQLDVYEEGYEWINHSMAPLHHNQIAENPRVKIGSEQCSKPYEASIFNVSAMSFGSLSKNAILSLNHGAKLGGFSHNTGEGGLSPYHLEPGGDVIWNIGTGYFSCRNADGSFSEAEFEKRAILPNVKMIEIKFSQGAKPGHGGILPASKVTAEIAKIRLVEMGHDIVSPPSHSAFTNPLTFLEFVKKLRKLSGGKPIGFKLCVGDKIQFLSICKAMVDTQTYVDFITVDGGEGGTGAAPYEFANTVGMPLREALMFVNDALVGYGIKNQIKVICSGKIISGFEIIRALALGADLCNSARGMMFAIGCIQALRCNNNSCPAGVATQNPDLTAGLVVEDKKTRVANYHKATVKSAVELMAAAGISHPDLVTRRHINRRLDIARVATYEEIYPELKSGAFLGNEVPENYRQLLQQVNTSKF